MAKYPGLKEAIFYNETLLGTENYLTPEELAAKFKCKTTYVYRLRYLLGLKGNQKPMSLQSIHSSAEVTSEGQLKDLLEEPLLTPLDRLKTLSKLIRSGSPPIKIAAIKAMEDLTKTSEGRIGPGVPLTDEAKITRLARLLLAVRQELAAQAWETAYGYPPSTAPVRAPIPVDSGEVTQPSEPVEESLPDLPIPSNRPKVSRSRPLPQDGPGEGPPV